MTDLVVRRSIVKSHNFDFFGMKKTGGIIYEASTPGAYLVRLHAKKGGDPIKTTVSGEDGSYSFLYLNGSSTAYYAVAFDHGAGPSSPAITDTLPITDMVIADF